MTRFRRGQPRPDVPEGTVFTDIQPDPSRVGGVAEAPFVRLPDPATLFSTRSRRFAELAKDHVLAPYLEFLAGVTATQAACVAALPSPMPVPAAQIALRAEHGFPPISVEQVGENADFSAALAWLLDHLDLATAPDAARAAAASLREMTEAERAALANDIFEGAFAVELVAKSVFVAAALQVHLARLASQFVARAITPPAEGVCPCCGGAPVASLVVGWTPANKARYCACSLCGTFWNHVRIKCTSCGSTEGIVHHAIEGGSKTIGIETCGSCRCYVKHMQQHEDPHLDPVADDVASYALDLLARGEDFHRASLNPLFLTG